MRNATFLRVALATGVLLLIPAVAMRFTDAIRWSAVDFLVMGALLFATGSLFVLATRKLPRRYWWVAAVVLAAAFLYAWAELAVGVFTGIGR